jgi:hypothetical protein
MDKLTLLLGDSLGNLHAYCAIDHVQNQWTVLHEIWYEYYSNLATCNQQQTLTAKWLMFEPGPQWWDASDCLSYDRATHYLQKHKIISNISKNYSALKPYQFVQEIKFSCSLTKSNILLRVLVLDTGFGLVTGFIELLYLVTTKGCNAVANLHT